MACPPDGVALLDIYKFISPETFYNCHKLEPGTVIYYLSTVEINCAVYASSISAYLSLTTTYFNICSVVSEAFRTYIPQNHTGQVIHQMVVFGFNSCINIAEAET